MSAVIIDGISGAGKTLLLQGLQRVAQEQVPNYSKLIITEHMTERFFEKVTPSVCDVHTHVARILRLVDQLQLVRAAGPFATHDRILTIAVERLFLTLISRRLMTSDFFVQEAELIASLKLRHVFLVVPDEQIEERIARSLSHRTKAWADYVDSLGGLRGAVQYFSARQTDMTEANAQLPDSITRKTLEIFELEQLKDNELLEELLWSRHSLS
ncbi:MAG: hypothetical protein CENE_03668 [Candidatus Celerinatantimonas neptuna]|nr:MAG: hypothetical protein CENE_03668 [Candidatus Celerinatantimonas neptuna]